MLGGWKQFVDGQEREGLSWQVRRGERWGVFGPNGTLPILLVWLKFLYLLDSGSGKTTLLSLLGSDHPQSYSLPIKLFGKRRLPLPGQRGISIFDIQARLGQSSPEIHSFFPRNLSLRQSVANAWSDTFLGTPRMNQERKLLVDRSLAWFEDELNFLKAPQIHQIDTATLSEIKDTGWADKLRFGDSPFSAQRVILLLRAIVKKPDLVILDEAFSGMDDKVRNKCLRFLTWGERQIPGLSSKGLGPGYITGLTNDQALINVSHVEEEVPGLVREWICLPEAIEGTARFGRLDGPLEGQTRGWEDIWGV